MKASEIRNFGNVIIEMIQSENGRKLVENIKKQSFYNAGAWLKTQMLSHLDRTIIAVVKPELLEYAKGSIDEAAQIVVTVHNAGYLKNVDNISLETYKFIAMRCCNIASEEEENEMYEMKKAAERLENEIDNIVDEIIFGK